MADTSELREKIARRLHWASHPNANWDDARPECQQRLKEADAILALPGLQAEAPEDAEVDDFDRLKAMDYIEQCLNGEGWMRSERANLENVLRALQSRTSQAEAQAPAVLTATEVKTCPRCKGTGDDPVQGHPDHYFACDLCDGAKLVRVRERVV